MLPDATHHSRSFFPRSFLFVPADRIQVIDKALGSQADAIVVDLEDAIAPSQKSAARAALQQIATTTRQSDDALSRVYVRINGSESPWFDDDLDAVASFSFAGVIVAKVQCLDDLARVRHGLNRHRVSDKNPAKMIALIETPLGIMRAADFAGERIPGLTAIAFGAEDFRAAMRIGNDHASGLFDFARATVSTAAAAAGVPAIDAPELDLGDVDGLRRATEKAKQYGFSAKFAIHPKQIATLHEVFTTTMAERVWAEKVLQSYEDAQIRGYGTATADGRMVDAATVAIARALMDRCAT